MQSAYHLSDEGPTHVEGALAARLQRDGRRHRFAAGTLIQQQGDRGGGFWLVESGAVNVCRFAPDGEVTVFAVLNPGDLFGELAYFAGVPRQVDAVAEQDSVLVWIDARTIERMLDDEPAFARWLLRSLALQLRGALDRIDRDRRHSAEARMARLLLEMAGRSGPELRATQRALGDYLGVSRITSGQVLNRMAAAGLIRIGYGRITVTDRQGLRALLASAG